MADISDVPGITGSTLDLFREAEVDRIETLISLRIEDIYAKLKEINARYEVAVRLPSEELILAWQEAGRAVLRKGQVRKAPEAKPVPAEILGEAGIDLSALPEAKIVQANTPPSDQGLKTLAQAEAEAETEEAGRPVPTPAASQPGPRPDPPAPESTPEPEPAAVEPRTELKTPASRPHKEKQAPPPNVKFKQVQEVRSVKDQGERRNRGMSHPEAGRVRWAATVTFFTPILAVFAALALIGSLIMTRFYHWEFHPSTALLLLVFPFCLILYLTQGAKVRCRLCGQRLFVPKNCRKHERASRSIFGHTFAVARSAMLFASFRCMLCGTKTRLKD